MSASVSFVRVMTNHGAWWTCLMLSVLAGCSVRSSTFDIVDYREPGEAMRYRETFEEAYYKLDGQGNVDLVLRHVPKGEAGVGQALEQVIHIHSVWRSIPGQTVAHRTQINGRIHYYVVIGQTGTSFEGAGSVFFRPNRRDDTLSGSLEFAVLNPKRQLAGSATLFKQMELTGRFRARRNPRRVVHILHEINRLFSSVHGSGALRNRAR